MNMKMRLQIKNRSHRYGINRPRPRHGRKFSNTEAELKKSVAYKKSV